MSEWIGNATNWTGNKETHNKLLHGKKLQEVMMKISLRQMSSSNKTHLEKLSNEEKINEGSNENSAVLFIPSYSMDAVHPSKAIQKKRTV